MKKILNNKETNPFGYFLEEVERSGMEIVSFLERHRSSLCLWNFSKPEFTLCNGLKTLKFTVNACFYKGDVCVSCNKEDEKLFEVFLLESDGSQSGYKDGISFGQLMSAIDQVIEGVNWMESDDTPTFSFYQDVKLSIWERKCFDVKARNEQEAIEFVKRMNNSVVSELDSGRIGEDIASEFLLDAAENLTVENNAGRPTIELYYNKKLIADNTQLIIDTDEASVINRNFDIHLGKEINRIIPQ